MKQIGIFGGSFDPIHDGHMAVAVGTLQEGGVDEVWLMVSPENPLKKGMLHASGRHRLEMARLAVDSLPSEFKEKIKVSDFEFSLPRPSYTIDTLRALKEKYPAYKFNWIIGGDNLEIIYKWKDYDKILSEFGIIVYPRPEARIPYEIPEGITYINNVKEFPYSSSEIRAKLREKGEILLLPIPDAVKRYILSRPNLYS